MTSPLPHKVFIIFTVLIILFGFWFIYYLNYILNSETSLLKITRSFPLTTEPVSVSLNLASPTEHSLVYSSDLLIEGQTSPGGTIVISFPSNDQIIEADSKGQFSYTALLTEGVNQFKITSFDSVGNSKSESRTVYYSKEKI